MHFSFSGFVIFMIGLIVLLFNRKLAVKTADYEEMFTKKPKDQLIRYYRIFGYIGGTLFVIAGFLHMFMII